MSLALTLSACGADSNLLALTIPDAHKQSFEALIDLGQAAYDRNDLQEALKLSKEAYRLDPYSERAAVLYGYINLSLAGGDPFSLASGMIAANKKKAEDKAKAEESTTALALADGKNSSETLTALKSILGISDEEMEIMSTMDTSDAELPVLIPKCVEDARHAAQRLVYIDEAINAVCRFTDVEARIPTDYRQDCRGVDYQRTKQNQVHFLWAFAHLTEALAFNSILTYATVDPERKKTNLELRVEKLKSIDATTPEGLSAFIASVNVVSLTLNAILPVSGACSDTAPTSQLRATLNDMLAVDAAFARMPGMPQKITGGISKAMAKIKGAEGQSAGVTAQTKSMKGDFTKKLSGSLAEKIDALGADPTQPLSEDKKTALCTTFAEISTDPSTSAVCAGGTTLPESLPEGLPTEIP